MEIIVNGKKFVTLSKAILYEEVCNYAGINKELNPSMVWFMPGTRLGGTLIPSKSVEVINGMVFNVVNTGNA